MIHWHKDITKKQEDLKSHKLYSVLNTTESINSFMESHIFCVLDFMTILKGLQKSLHQFNLPWRPSPYSSEIIRMINEIVIDEESDQLPTGEYASHFTLYLKAMKESGANSHLIDQWLQTHSLEHLPLPIKNMVQFHFDLASEGNTVKLASAFFLGRENIIPAVFTNIIENIKEYKEQNPLFYYYLERHNELDGDEHGPLGEALLDKICGSCDNKRATAIKTAVQTLSLREKLWDHIVENIEKNSLQGSNSNSNLNSESICNSKSLT